MTVFARSDNSLVTHWWWEVDRWLLLAIGMLITIGIFLTFAASPPVAERLGLAPYHFVIRQGMFLCVTVTVMICLSVADVRSIRRFAALLFPLALFGVVTTLLFGAEIKGATRWLHFASFSLQPSEFLKPAFVVVTAWMLSQGFHQSSFPGRRIATGLFLIVVSLLVMQPDVGQTILITAVWSGQMFLAGLPMFWVLALAVVAITALIGAYIFLPHVAGRINAFLDPASSDTFQTDTALNAIKSGGIFGRGPGEGSVKNVLPDAHTDYIFAVAGEEFGAVACLAILLIFAAIVIRGVTRLLEEEDAFTFLACFGLLAQFGLQALINIGVNLAILPPKGMTLPFISYGGSSMLALGVTMGMLLALTRRNRFLQNRRQPRRAGWGAIQ